MSVNIQARDSDSTFKVESHQGRYPTSTSDLCMIICVCVCGVCHIYVYIHVNMNACTFHSQIHMQYKDPKQNKINVEGNIFIIELQYQEIGSQILSDLKDTVGVCLTHNHQLPTARSETTDSHSWPESFLGEECDIPKVRQGHELTTIYNWFYEFQTS